MLKVDFEEVESIPPIGQEEGSCFEVEVVATARSLLGLQPSEHLDRLGMVDVLLRAQAVERMGQSGNLDSLLFHEACRFPS
jgi:hypothetical protein